VAGLLLLIIAGLSLTIFSLVRGRAAAREDAAGARAETAAARAELSATRAELSGEKGRHRATQEELSRTQAALGQAKRDMDAVRRELGLAEVRAKEVTGKVLVLFKKRIAQKARAGADTGISDTLVDGLLLNKGWPAIRGCYPVTGPLPQRMKIELQVQPNGRVGEVTTDAAPPARPCVEAALSSLRFPPFSGALFVRITYQLQRMKR
jgi:hypothetical protein